MKKRLSLAVLLCFLPSAIEAFTQEQEQVLASRWNTSWLTCDLVEILIATAGRYYSFKLNDSEVIQLSVNWEQHQPTSTFEKKIPKIGTFTKISPEQRAGFVSALTYDYDQREQILARVIQDICTTEKEKRQLLKFSKELTFAGTVSLFRHLFVGNRAWQNIENDFSLSYIPEVTMDNRTFPCPEYEIPKGLQSQPTDSE